MTLRSGRSTFVKANETTSWGSPRRTVTLRCNREAGDRRLCDALHEFILSRLEMQRYRPPLASPPFFPSLREVTYQYASDATLEVIRRCVASIPEQVRLNSWIHLSGRASSGAHWDDSPHGSTNSDMYRPADLLDASGGLPTSCGETSWPARAVSRPPAMAASRAVVVTPVATVLASGPDATAVAARSDGWVALTPVASYPRGNQPRLYSRAIDAQRWVARARDVLSGKSLSDSDNTSRDFIPSLGRGVVNLETRVDGAAGHRSVSMRFNDCRGVARVYVVDSAAVAAIADAVEGATFIALSSSRPPVPPTLDRAYEEGDVSCPAVPLDQPASRVAPQGRRFSVQFVVDTLGSAETESIRFTTEPAREVAAAVTAEVLSRRFRPARWADIKVRQVVRTTVTLAAPPV